MKKIFRLLGLCVCAAACNNPSQNLSEPDFADSVTKALANNGHIDDYCIECSTDGVTFSQMRICHMYKGAEEISFGIYACSPEESSFTAIFTDMKITECMWKAHDGQQPDM